MHFLLQLVAPYYSALLFPWREEQSEDFFFPAVKLRHLPLVILIYRLRVFGAPVCNFELQFSFELFSLAALHFCKYSIYELCSVLEIFIVRCQYTYT